MNIIDHLTDLANSLPYQFESDDKVKNLSCSVQKAIETNDSAMLKSFISSKEFYAHEVKVTVY